MNPQKTDKETQISNPACGRRGPLRAWLPVHGSIMFFPMAVVNGELGKYCLALHRTRELAARRRVGGDSKEHERGRASHSRTRSFESRRAARSIPR